jgi:hypothetical protein
MAIHRSEEAVFHFPPFGWRKEGALGRHLAAQPFQIVAHNQQVAGLDDPPPSPQQRLDPEAELEVFERSLARSLSCGASHLLRPLQFRAQLRHRNRRQGDDVDSAA